MIAGNPHQGGATWAVLQYVLGLRALGHEVYLVEPLSPSTVPSDSAPLSASLSATYFRDVVARFDLEDRATLLRQDTRETIGLPYSDLRDAVRAGDLLINVSGMLTDPALLEALPRRVYLDLDPAFNQLWHAVENVDMRFSGHTHFVTVGTLIGSSECDVPTCNRRWLPTLQPIVLPEWPRARGAPSGGWTTVGNWRGYGSIKRNGVLYGQKAHSFRRFVELPRRIPDPCRPALAIHPAEVSDLRALRTHGWDLVDPIVVAGTPDRYREFIRSSKGELGIAKSGYVEARCGWFSDRSVCYLASGRPVVAQDTGFGDALPTGEGLFAFGTLDEAVTAIETANADYDRHCQRAREIAEAHFRSDVVLAALIEQVGAAHDSSRQPTQSAGVHSGASARP